MRKLFKRNAGAIARHLSKPLDRELRRQAAAIDSTRMLLGQLHTFRVRGLPDGAPLRDAEFSVYSQRGEDGIIEYLLSRMSAPSEVFVEFGVQDYRESNTRFLLKNRNWRGLVLDGGAGHIESIRREEIHWRYDLTAVHAFVTAENINDLIRENGVSGEIGLLSVDIDGNDYWVWKAIDVVSPQVVICEFNSVLGIRHAVTVPYRGDFARTEAHPSNLFFGASLRALCQLPDQKGYAFLGCCTAGVNAFFVRRDCMRGLAELSPEQGYVVSRIRESRDDSGALTFVGREDRFDLVAECEVYDVATGAVVRLGDLGPDRA